MFRSNVYHLKFKTYDFTLKQWIIFENMFKVAHFGVKGISMITHHLI
jgi:hypothetical protein